MKRLARTALDRDARQLIELGLELCRIVRREEVEITRRPVLQMCSYGDATTR